MEEPNNQEEFSNDSSQKSGTGNETEENSEKITSENNNSNSETHLEPTENPKEGNTNASSAGNELSLICQEDISNDSVISETNLEVVNTKVAQKIKKRKSHSKEEPEKPTCKHESNNFKIIKRRFRCADCGAIACPECLVVASMTLHRHLHSADSDNDYKIFPCNLCDLYFLSQCSLQAHTRIHMLDSPYVCPDCGCIYSNIYYLSLHLINKCYHVYKVMKFRCSICQYTFKSADTFSDHIRNVHIKSIVVCSDCGSMFDDIDYFEKHALCSHNNAQVEKELFIRCTLCVSSAMPKSLEGDHINYHREHSVSHQFMYICPCGSNHNTMTSFRGHLQSCKKKKVLPAHWNFLQTKIKAQEVKNLNLKKDDKEETCFPDSPDSGICNNCGEELVDSEVATCKKCLEKEPENHKPSLEILQNSDIVVIKLNDDNNGNEIQPEYLENETENVNRDLKNEEESMEVIYLEDENKDSSKVVYNHVPNDHLGYLKTSGNNKIGHFQTETILDEETGILKSSKFWIGKERKGEEMQGIRVQNSGTTTTTYADYKKKNKDSFFSCPFCSTLFFKHESSFQKFLLHVECYHNDAGMDIEADKDDVLNQKKPLIVIRSDEESEEEESPPQPETNSQKPEIFRPRVIHEDDKKSQNMANLPKKKRITLLKITTSPVKKSIDFFPEEKKTESKNAVKSLNFQTESKKLNGVTENLIEISTPSKKVSDTEENKLNDSNDSSLNKEEDSETSMSSRSLRKKRTSDETPKKDHEVWDEFYASLKIAEKYKFKKKKSAESVDDAEKVSVVSDYSSKRVVKKPKRFMISSGDESDEYSETEKEKEKINTLKISDSPEKEKTETDSVTKKINDQKFVESLFNFVEKKEKQIDLYKKHSELRLNPPPKDYRKGVLNGIKIRGRPKKFVPFNERSVLKSLPQPSPSKIKKRGRPRKPSSSSERISDYDKEVNFIEKNFETEDKDGAKRKRKLSTKIQFYQKMSSDTAEFSSGQLINNKIGINKKFTCAMCKDTYPNVTEFREHIIGHRADENTYQCMECGEIFVVRPSLVKHLHAFHKIKDIDKYIVENNCTLSENEKVEEPEPLKENQCKVCKDQFDSPGDLSKHFRVHGMAFLKEVKKETQKEELQRKEITRKGTGNVGNF